MQPIPFFAINKKTLFIAFTASRIRVVFELQKVLATNTICFLVGRIEKLTGLVAQQNLVSHAALLLVFVIGKRFT